MEIFKKRGFIYGDYVLNYIEHYIERTDIYCNVEAFNNCREQGYIVNIHSKNNYEYDENDHLRGLTLYLYNNRHSDEPSVTWENYSTFRELYSEEAWTERSKTFEHVEDLAVFVNELIEKAFEEGEKNED